MQQAMYCYLRATRINPTDVNIRINLASLFRAREDEVNANRHYQIIMALDPVNRDCHDDKAMMLFEKGQYKEAIEHMDAAVKICVGSSPILEMEYALLVKNKGLTYQEMNRRRQQQMLSQIRTSVHARRTSRDLNEVGKRRYSVYAELLGDKKSLVEMKKMLAGHLANRGKIYEQIKEIDKAAEDYLSAACFDPLSYHVYFHLGTLALHQQKLDEAIEFFSQTLILNPKLGVACLNLGVAYTLAQSYDKALQHLDQAASLIPHCAFVWANRACVFMKMGNRADDALQSLSHALRCMPTFAPFYVYRGRMLSARKHLHDAMVDFTAALKMGYKDTI
ncbi:hypothetical protein AC1031_010614 [Aphanomyces cochlioides]|nr:hypothetical protein AC1031_010614 [Aphanomyces cochlioides]